MACDLTSGRGIACKSIGGIKHIELANFNGAGATFSAEGSISAFDTATTFYKFNLRGANNSIDETGESSRDNNTSFVSISGSIQLPYQEEETRKELETLSKARVYIIAVDYNGVRKLYGYDDGCDISVNTNSGAGMGDFNGYTLNISGVNTTLAQIVLSGASNIALSTTQITPN